MRKNIEEKDFKNMVKVFVIATFILVVVAGISYAYLDYHNNYKDKIG